ncbi:SH3 domain-containing protein [Undibacterium baiyunense]|uniref:SH3 domain-containing protein n=1 Tax=Undibacterium baiyunense TaxID=2828731 RepID=A0A941DBP7_9BURK|nr:SH3 domain-containing protein [Undibacterium baiyunense]MBR7745734.1 SH3 domain-containing protein [Undibacterium baiyunense]
MRLISRLSTLVLLGLGSVSASSFALEFRSVGATPIIMYDAPSARGMKIYVAPAGMPVEIILTSGAWCRVRDMNGDLSWVEAKDLIPRRNLIVKTANARIRVAPEESASMVFSADKNVLLEMAEPAIGAWVKVKHRDGQTGFVRTSEVWGL